MHSFKAFLVERELTAGEKAKAEKIVKGMKKSKEGFQDRYGDKAKSVMYATATKLAKEDVQLDELSKDTLRKYIGASAEDSRHHGILAGSGEKASDYERVSGEHRAANALRKVASKRYAISHKRLQGIKLAAKKLAKEEVELNELSKDTLKNYTKKALDSIRTHAYISGHHDADNMYGAGSANKKSELTGKSVRYYAKAIKRGKGVQAAVNRLTKEDTQINELKTDTMKKYIQTAADDLRHQAGLDAHYKRDFGSKPGPTEKKLLDKKHRKVSTRLRGIKTAADRIAGRSDWE